MAIDDMSLEELKAISPVFEEDIYDAISMETCVNKRLTIGAPGKEAMEKVVALEKNILQKSWLRLVKTVKLLKMHKKFRNLRENFSKI